MPQQDPYGFEGLDSAFFEAEVAPKVQQRFQQRYRAATGLNVTPQNPPQYQSQPNKRAAECRIYFNSHVVAVTAKSLGFNVKTGHPYKDRYRYRINNNDLWWELVENYGFRLGTN
jgi:hypothetical protein